MQPREARRVRKAPPPSFVDWMFHYNVTTAKWGYQGSNRHNTNVSRSLIDMIQDAVRDGKLTSVGCTYDLCRYIADHNLFGWSETYRPILERIWAEYQRACKRAAS
jgi:hypothetical protein